MVSPFETMLRTALNIERTGDVIEALTLPAPNFRLRCL